MWRFTHVKNLQELETRQNVFENGKILTWLHYFTHCSSPACGQAVDTDWPSHTFQGASVGREDHLLCDRFGSGVVVDVLRQKQTHWQCVRVGKCMGRFTHPGLCLGSSFGDTPVDRTFIRILFNSTFDTFVCFLICYWLTRSGGTHGTEASSPSSMGFPANTTLMVLVYTSLGMLLSLHTEREHIVTSKTSGCFMGVCRFFLNCLYNIKWSSTDMNGIKHLKYLCSNIYILAKWALKIFFISKSLWYSELMKFIHCSVCGTMINNNNNLYMNPYRLWCYLSLQHWLTPPALSSAGRKREQKPKQ